MSKVLKYVSFGLVVIFGCLFLVSSTNAYYWVDGHYRDTDYGSTYVEGHWRSDPNEYTWDNLGSDGVDLDNDGYGAGDSNWGYDYDYDYDYGYDSYDSYDYGYDSGFDSYDYSYDLDW